MSSTKERQRYLAGAGGGGKGGGGAARSAQEDPDSLVSRQLAKIKDVLSEGEVAGWGKERALQCVAFDRTLVENPDESLNFHNFDIYFVPGTQDQSYIPGFDADESIFPQGTEVKASVPWTQGLSAQDVDAVRIDIHFPRLQQQNTTNGDITGTSVDLAIDLQSNGGGFVTVVSDRVVGMASSAYVRSYRVELGGFEPPWDIRVRRLTPDSTSQALQNKTFVESYSEIRYGKLRHPNTAIVGLSFDAEQFGTNIPVRAYYMKGVFVRVPLNYDPVTRTYATTGPGTSNGAWNGEWKTAFTNNPVWLWYEMATNKRWGLGEFLGDTPDKFVCYLAAQYCDQMVPDGRGGEEPRFTGAIYWQRQADGMQILSDMASVFRGMLTYIGGSLIPIQNRPVNADTFSLYSPTNVINGRFLYSGTALRARHTAAEVQYIDNDNFGDLATVAYEDHDAVLKYGYNALKLNNIGCTSRNTAYKAAKWAVLAEKLLNDTVQFSTGLEGLAELPGNVAQIQDPFRSGAEWSGRLTAVTPTQLTLDIPVTLEAGTEYFIAVKKTNEDGTTATLPVLNAAGTTSTITVATIDFPPDVGTEWQLSSAALRPQLFQILSVSPRPDGTVDIVALEYNESLFAHLDDAVPLDEPPVSVLPNPSFVQPPVAPLTANIVTVIEGAQPRLDVVLSWQASTDAFLRGYRVSYRIDGGNWETLPEVPTHEGRIRGIQGGAYDISVVAVNRIGNTSQPLTTSIGTAVQPENMPHATGLELEGQGNVTEWQQRDAKLAWRLNSPTLAGRAGVLSSAGLQDPYFVAYEVLIKEPLTGETVWRELATAPRFAFTHDKNVEAMYPDPPLAQFDCEVRVINTYNIPDTDPASGRFTNPPPPAPVNFSATAAFRTVFLRWQNPIVADMSVIEIWENDENLFETATKIAEASYPATMHAASGEAGTEKWFFLVARDTFGNRSQPTAAASVTPGQIPTQDIEPFAIDATRVFLGVILLQGDTWETNVPPGGVSWNEHSLFHRGTEYVIAAGSTVNEFVTWTVGATQYTGTDTRPEPGNDVFLVVWNRNHAGVPIRAWQSFANIVVGSANILNAAIQTAHIGDAQIGTAQIADAAIIDAHIQNLSGDKIDANTIRADRLAVGNESDNLITNPSFEASLANWESVEGSGTFARVAIADAPDGGFALQLLGGTDYGVGHRLIAVSPGVPYVLRVKAKGTGAGGSAYIGINEAHSYPGGRHFIDVSNRSSYADLSGHFAPPTTSWGSYEYTYTPGPAVRFVSISLYNWQSGGATVWFDAVEFRKQFVGGDIRAGSIEADRLKAGSVLSSQLFVQALLELASGGSIRSAGFASGPGGAGFQMLADGSAEFQRVVIRDAVVANSLAAPIGPATQTFATSTFAISFTGIPSDSQVYYTIDDTSPITSGTRTLYSGAFSISQTRKVRWYAQGVGSNAGRRSDETEATYTKVATAPPSTTEQFFVGPNSGSVTVPAGATRLMIEVSGGGGAGHSGAEPYDGGNGGYASREVILSGDAGKSISYGAGGPGAGSSATASTLTNWTGTMTADAGGPATSSSSGADGTATGGTTNTTGGGGLGGIGGSAASAGRVKFTWTY